MGGVRRVNTRSAALWDRQVRAGEDPVAETQRPTGSGGLREDAMARLHLAEGFAWDELEARWGADPIEVLGVAVMELRAGGLARERPDGRIALTRDGFDRADEALGRILSDRA